MERLWFDVNVAFRGMMAEMGEVMEMLFRLRHLQNRLLSRRLLHPNLHPRLR